MKYETLVLGCEENEHTVPLHCLCANGLRLELLLAFLAVIHEGLNGPWPRGVPGTGSERDNH